MCIHMSIRFVTPCKYAASVQSKMASLCLSCYSRRSLLSRSFPTNINCKSSLIQKFCCMTGFVTWAHCIKGNQAKNTTRKVIECHIKFLIPGSTIKFSMASKECRCYFPPLLVKSFNVVCKRACQIYFMAAKLAIVNFRVGLCVSFCGCALLAL